MRVSKHKTTKLKVLVIGMYLYGPRVLKSAGTPFIFLRWNYRKGKYRVVIINGSMISKQIERQAR
jgi:hypothetical protein